jgi:hypothetical protein
MVRRLAHTHTTTQTEKIERSTSLNPVTQQAGGDKTALRPFHVNVPEADLTELRRRINATRFPE